MWNNVTSLARASLLLIAASLAIPGIGSSVEAAGSFKMGVVDPQAVLEQSRAGKRALASMKQYAKTRQKILEGDETELKKLEQELRSQSSVRSDQEKEEKQQQFRQKVQAYQQRVQEFNQDLAAKQKDLVDEYMEKISAATKTVAEKRGLALVMDKGSESTMKIVIYNQKSVDITNHVIREFNRRYK
jgi:outer membrane protein